MGKVRLFLVALAGWIVLPMAHSMAAAPTSTSEVNDYTQVLQSCSGFDVIGHIHAVNTSKVFTDNDGQFVKHIARTLVEITYVNSVTGESVTGRGATTYIFTEKTTQAVGLNLVITVPGEGVGALVVGITRTEDNQVVFQHGVVDTTFDMCAAVS